MKTSILGMGIDATRLAGFLFFATMFSALGGCSAAPGDESQAGSQQGEPVATVASPLLNGTQMPIRALVSMIAPNGDTCGGTMLNSRTIITAGHCVTGSMNSYNQQVNMRIAYWRPSDGAVLCLAGTNGCSTGVPVTVHLNPNYTARYDYDDDIAILISPTPWVGVSGTADYAYIFVAYLHTIGPLGNLNPPRPLAVAGTGPQDANNTGNTVPNFIQRSNAYLGWTRTAYNILASDFPVCAGDSGGPILAPLDSSGTPMVVGTASSALAPDGTNALVPGNICTSRSDVHVYYTAIGAKLSWINSYSTVPERLVNTASTLTYAYFF